MLNNTFREDNTFRSTSTKFPDKQAGAASFTGGSSTFLPGISQYNGFADTSQYNKKPYSKQKEEIIYHFSPSYKFKAKLIQK